MHTGSSGRNINNCRSHMKTKAPVYAPYYFPSHSQRMYQSYNPKSHHHGHGECPCQMFHRNHYSMRQNTMQSQNTLSNVGVGCAPIYNEVNLYNEGMYMEYPIEMNPVEMNPIELNPYDEFVYPDDMSQSFPPVEESQQSYQDDFIPLEEVLTFEDSEQSYSPNQSIESFPIAPCDYIDAEFNSAIKTETKNQHFKSNCKIEKNESTNVKKIIQKRSKSNWTKMTKELFNKIVEYEKGHENIKQCELERIFNVNRSTYWRWKKQHNLIK